uniref:Uncharacterized protein n=1 Tax=Avena sativa TaxID=4498 RepID=A0ACD5YXK0_AVESA
MQPQSHMVASNAPHQHAPAPQTVSNGFAAPAMSAPNRKRGRPRKHDLNATMPLAIMPAPYPAIQPWGLRGLAGLVSPQVPPALPPPSTNPTQQVRNRRMAAAGPGAMGIYPEIITIQFGEDIATKVMSFSGNGWAACVMSANGAVSRVTMRQGAYSQEIVTYEGYFEIISLSGSYQPSETGGRCMHRGGLGVLLAGLDGRVFCGGVAGPLTAASPVQVVIGRFPVDDKNKLKPVVTSGTPGASSSTLNGSSGMQA